MQSGQPAFTKKSKESNTFQYEKHEISKQTKAHERHEKFIGMLAESAVLAAGELLFLSVVFIWLLDIVLSKACAALYGLFCSPITQPFCDWKLEVWP